MEFDPGINETGVDVDAKGALFVQDLSNFCADLPVDHHEVRGGGGTRAAGESGWPCSCALWVDDPVLRWQGGGEDLPANLCRYLHDVAGPIGCWHGRVGWFFVRGVRWRVHDC